MPFRWFLEWAYTGKIASLLDPAEDVTAVCDLMCLAKSLAVEELKVELFSPPNSKRYQEYLHGTHLSKDGCFTCSQSVGVNQR